MPARHELREGPDHATEPASRVASDAWGERVRLRLHGGHPMGRAPLTLLFAPNGESVDAPVAKRIGAPMLFRAPNLRPGWLLLPLAAAATLVWAAPALGAAGDLDPSFDGDGRLVQNLGQLRRDGPATSMVRQSDGKYVTAGTYNGLTEASGDFMVVRYMPDGSLDPSFGGDGIVITDFGGAERATDVELQPDGKIVVVGYAFDQLVARYEPDGDLDPTFSGDGKVSTNLFSGLEVTTAVALDSAGRIVVVGSDDVGPRDMSVSRYTSAGTLDGTFDGDGKRTVDLGGDDIPEGVAIGGGDKVVVAGTSASLFALARLNTDGSLDTNADADPGTHFGTDGIVTTDVGAGSDVANDVAIQSDGKVLAAGNSGANFGLARYNSADGSLDTSFDPVGNDGTVTTNSGPNTESRAESVALDAGAKIVIAGTVQTTPPGTSDFAVARYNPNGSLDSNADADPATHFGTDGLVTNPEGDGLLGVRAEPGGKVIAAGQTDGYAAVARYETDGDLDTTFSGNGIADDPLIVEPSEDFVSSGYVYPDGKILTLGPTFLGERGGDNAVLTRHNPDGSLDSGFGSGGIATVSVSQGGHESIGDVLVGDDGKIVVQELDDPDGLGGVAAHSAFAKLNPDGSLDTTFDGDGKLSLVGDTPRASGLLADGSLVVVSTNGGSELIRKFTTTGIPDPSFGGGDGVAPYLPAGGSADVLGLTGGKFVVASRSGGGSGLARYEADGDLDLSFGGGDGFVTTGFDPGFKTETLAQPDGKIIVIGGISDFGVMRYTKDGAPDAGFGGGDGLVTEDFGANEAARDVALQPDGKILVAGSSVDFSIPKPSDFALARYTPAGAPDASFGGGDGKLLTNFLPTADDFALAVGVQPGGKIVLAGDSESVDPTGDVALARYLPDPPRPTNTSPPSIPTSGNVGQTVACTHGVWTGSPTSFVFSWTRDGATIANEHASSYKLRAGDAGHTIRCRVVAHNAGGDSQPATSNALSVTNLPPSNTSPPTIPSTGKVGNTVTCKPGTWTGSPPSFAFSWTFDGSSIANQHGKTYRLGAGDAAHTIRCQVVARNAGGSSAPATSNALKVKRPPSSCKDLTLPKSAINKPKAAFANGKLLLKGTASDVACGKRGQVVRVIVTIARHLDPSHGKNRCRFLLESGRALGPVRGCDGKPPIVFPATGTSKWSLTMVATPPKATYTIRSLAADAAGNLQPVTRTGPNVMKLKRGAAAAAARR